MKFSFCLATAVLLIVAGLTGCGGEAANSNGSNSPDDSKNTTNNQAPPQIVRVSGDRIKFESDQLISNLDERRLDICPPSGWSMGPRQAQSIIWFRFKRAAQLPRILVSSEEPIDAFPSVTKENVVEFAKSIKKEIDAQGLKLVEREVLPIIAGDQACARYVVGGQMGGASVDRQVLVTQANGRRYRVELQSYTESFEEYRDAGYSVLASMKFQTSTEDNEDKSKAGSDNPDSK